MVHDPAVPGAFELRYWGVTGRDYYLARSWDLLSWQYFPVIEPGQDAVVSYSFIDPAPQVFVRLVHEPASGPNPYAADSDGDGLTNQQEIDLRTDLFSTDTDHDKLPDAWEVAHGLDPRNPADALADPNGNGLNDLEEYQNGNDPHLQAYGGVQPTIAIISGDGQLPVPGQFLPLPMRARIYRPDGTPWAGVPVHFRADANESMLSAAPDGSAPLRTTLTVISDQNGYAQAWVSMP